MDDDEINAERESEESDLTEKEETSTSYRLVGIVVHSGQASGGHYYSYIRYVS